MGGEERRGEWEERRGERRGEWEGRGVGGEGWKSKKLKRDVETDH